MLSMIVSTGVTAKFYINFFWNSSREPQLLKNPGTQNVEMIIQNKEAKKNLTLF